MNEAPTDIETPIEDMHNSMAAARQMRHPPFTDRDLWIAIRGGLIDIVKGIEQFAKGSPLAAVVRSALLGIIAAIEMRWYLRRYRSSKER